MPFWHGDSPGRPLEFGRRIGEFLDFVQSQPSEQVSQTLGTTYHLDEHATHSLLEYVVEQKDVVGIPTHKHLIVERFLDQIGDWRICILSPFGARVHAPWAMAIAPNSSNCFPTISMWCGPMTALFSGSPMATECQASTCFSRTPDMSTN